MPLRLILIALLLGSASIVADRFASAQSAPPASAARMLILPRQIVSGERATLAVLDGEGRLTPGVTVSFSNGDSMTTDATGRALFVAPLNPGVIFASLPGRGGHVPTAILTPTEASSDEMVVTRAPHAVSLADRFELSGKGFCGDADANQVTVNGRRALVLASSPTSLVALPPESLNPGAATVQLSCRKKTARPFSMVFASLHLEAETTPIKPGESRVLAVQVTGTRAKLLLEARNLAPHIAELIGGTSVRQATSGGQDNAARFEVVGKAKGSFLVSIRLISASGPPRP